MKVIFRADALANIGTGHLMRCLALGQALQDAGGACSFITATGSGFAGRLSQEGFAVHEIDLAADPAATLSLLAEERPDWTVLDGYRFGPAMQLAIVSAGHRLLVIDDTAHLERYHADAVLNQNAGAEAIPYRTATDTLLLRGSSFVMLRREFLRSVRTRREVPVVAKNLLVTMGGSDPENGTMRILHAIEQAGIPLHVRIVAGAANTRIDELRTAASRSRNSVEVLTNVSDMAPLMAWADMAVSAGGTTVWELAYMGVPSLLGVIAPNQELSVREMEHRGIFRSLGLLAGRTIPEIAAAINALAHERHARMQMTEAALAFIDGQGVRRVMNTLQELSGRPRLWLLQDDVAFGVVRFTNFINLGDDQREMVRTWRNSEPVRKWMFCEHVISAEEHGNFLRSLPGNTRSGYWMVSIDGLPSGVGSFQQVNAEQRSGHLGIYSIQRGVGKVILEHLIRLWFDLLEMNVLVSEVREGNSRAYDLYRAAGFSDVGCSVHSVMGKPIGVRILELRKRPGKAGQAKREVAIHHG